MDIVQSPASHIAPVEKIHKDKYPYQERCALLIADFATVKLLFSFTKRCCTAVDLDVPKTFPIPTQQLTDQNKIQN